MKDVEFRIGDRVELVIVEQFNEPVGSTGIVIKDAGFRIRVRWDHYPYRHDDGYHSIYRHNVKIIGTSTRSSHQPDWL